MITERFKVSYNNHTHYKMTPTIIQSILNTFGRERVKIKSFNCFNDSIINCSDGSFHVDLNLMVLHPLTKRSYPMTTIVLFAGRKAIF